MRSHIWWFRALRGWMPETSPPRVSAPTQPLRKSQRHLWGSLYGWHYLGVTQRTLNTNWGSGTTRPWLPPEIWMGARFCPRSGRGCWPATGTPAPQAGAQVSGRLVPPYGFPDPLQVAAYLGIDTSLSGSVTGDVAPGHDALQGTPTDQGSPGVTL